MRLNKLFYEFVGQSKIGDNSIPLFCGQFTNIVRNTIRSFINLSIPFVTNKKLSYVFASAFFCVCPK